MGGLFMRNFCEVTILRKWFYNTVQIRKTTYAIRRAEKVKLSWPVSDYFFYPDRSIRNCGSCNQFVHVMVKVGNDFSHSRVTRGDGKPRLG